MDESLLKKPVGTRDFELQRWWEPLLKILVEVITGVIIFSAIAAAAVGLNVIVHYLEQTQIADFFILRGLQGAEYALFSVDLILFARFLWRTSCRAWREL